ncbi:MAG: hypothetical protein KJZ80_19245 [Hyphomicrobiaceae bacterium]|nr:hypothetical protein [Hyphomicrobiaceae bacterium]
MSTSARIASLARSHDLLVEQNWQGVRMIDLIRTQLAPFVDAISRVTNARPRTRASAGGSAEPRDGAA